MRPSFGLDRARRGWDRFFFADGDLSISGPFRIAFACLLLVNALVLLPDLEQWFGESGALPWSASRAVVDPDTWSLFQWLPRTDPVLWTCYVVFLVQILALMAGLFTRVQAACVFVWLVSFQHRNLLIFDGEDTLFRLLCFLLIFLPAGEYLSVDRWLARRRARAETPADDARPVWPLRLVQIQVSVVYLSTAWEKLNGQAWPDGTAIYYASRLDDLWGRFPLPGFLFDSPLLVRLMTWSVLGIELLVPVGLWRRDTRRATLVVAALFHLATDYAMNLFLFQWLMLVGLLAFVERDDFRWLQGLRGTRVPGSPAAGGRTPQ